MNTTFDIEVLRGALAQDERNLICAKQELAEMEKRLKQQRQLVADFGRHIRDLKAGIAELMGQT